MYDHLISPLVSPVSPTGSRDGTGSGDHDEPFRGFRAYLFSTRQYARLLQLRGEALEARLGNGKWAIDLSTRQPT